MCVRERERERERDGCFTGQLKNAQARTMMKVVLQKKNIELLYIIVLNYYFDVYSFF